MNRFDECMEEVFAREGGYVDHPDDPGGATNMGITRRTLSEWFGRAVSKDDVKNLTRDTAKAIYRDRYWRNVRGDEMPCGLDRCLFDFAINSGPGRAGQHLQRAIGATADGIIGPMTMRRLARSNLSTTMILEEVNASRLVMMADFTHWPTFGRGWAKRVLGLHALCIQEAENG